MSAVRTLDRPVFAASEPERAPSLVAVIAAAAARAAVTAVSGLLLVVGLALLLWAVTPASGTTPTPLLRGGVAAFAAAHLLPVSIGGTVLTLPPMLLTLVFVGLLAAGAVRGRVPPDGLVQEAAAAVVAAAAYTGVVLASAAWFAPAGSVDLADGWRVGVLALVVTLIGTTVRGTAWRTAWLGTVPRWLQVGVRAGTAAAALLVAGGAAALLVGVVVTFGTASALAGLAAPSAGDGFGMALLGLAFIPTAVLAGTGYATGVGFQIGAGTYSPTGTHAVELPAVPLLAVVPSSGGPSLVGLTLLVVPLLAALLTGWAVVRRVNTRLERIQACVVAGCTAGAVLAVAAAVAGGGVTGSAWAHLGVPAVLFGAVVLVEVALPAAAVAAAAGWSRVPWTEPAPASDADSPSEGGDDAPESCEGGADADDIAEWDDIEDEDLDEDNGLIIWDSADDDEDDETDKDDDEADDTDDIDGATVDGTTDDGTADDHAADDPLEPGGLDQTAGSTERVRIDDRIDDGIDGRIDDRTEVELEADPFDGAPVAAEADRFVDDVDDHGAAADDVAPFGRGQAALDARVAQALAAQRLVRDSRGQ